MPKNDYDDHGSDNELNGIVFYTIKPHWDNSWGVTVFEVLNENSLLQYQFFIAGNVQHYEINDCLKHGLIPTVVDKEAILEMSNAIKSTENKGCENGEFQAGLVDIKVDTGMSRNGCQAHELQSLVTVRELWNKIENRIKMPRVGIHF